MRIAFAFKLGRYPEGGLTPFGFFSEVQLATVRRRLGRSSGRLTQTDHKRRRG
jgi:hypothetical protein